MFGILEGILTHLTEPGVAHLLLGFLLFFGLSGWSLLYRLAIVVSSLLHYMVLKHLIFLWAVFVSLGLFLFELVGLVS